MSIHNSLNIGFGRKVPLVLQAEAAECGLASLAMILEYHGKRYDLTQLRSKFGSSIKGVTLKDIVGVAEALELSTRPLRLELHELKQLKTPCIIHWDMSHFVVLVRVKSDHILIHDPAVGARKVSISETSKHFTGVALELHPTEQFSSIAQPSRVKISQLFGRFVGIKRTFFYLFVLAVLIEILGLVAPLFLSLVVDEAIVSADRDLLNVLALSFGFLLLLQVGISWLRSWSLMGLHASIEVQSRDNLAAHLLKLPVSYFESRHLGDILSRFGSQDTILNAVTEDIIEVILDGGMTILMLIVMFAIAPVLAMIAVIGACSYALIRVVTYTPIRQAEMEAIIWEARSETHLLETLRGIKAVKLNNAQNLRRIQWMNLNVEAINRNLEGEKIGLGIEAVNGLLVGLLTILMVWMGAQTILSGTLSVGLLLAFLAYSGVFLGRVSALTDTIIQLRMLKLHAERLADIALTAPEKTSGILAAKTGHNLKPVSIELRNISFRYSENEPFVLKNVSLHVASGEWIAIHGPSGGGKSTLLKIMSGLLQPTRGEVLINGEPLSYLGIDNFRRIAGVVLQEDQLFSGTLAENISFFSDSPDQGMIEASAKLASVHNDIIGLPMRYATLVGDMGTVLSGGQKQRVLMARALYKAPSILLLDEATSNLDVQNERHINSSINSLPLTRIVIAHRPETINAATRTIKMLDGRVAT